MIYYPITILRDRYNGTYSGGPWIALREEYCNIPGNGPGGSDRECVLFWKSYHGPVGRGGSPEEAYQSLVNELDKAHDTPDEEIRRKLLKGTWFVGVGLHYRPSVKFRIKDEKTLEIKKDDNLLSSPNDINNTIDAFKNSIYRFI